MNAQPPSNRTAIAVSELNKQVKSLLENSFLSIRVVGEISNLAKPSSGHWYFTLKDQKAQVRCAMFRGNNLRVAFVPKEGDQVVVTGRVSLYEGRGDYQMICNAMEQDGQGQLQVLFEKLKLKLQAQGLFDADRKKPIPEHPKCIGVITSPTGAAIHDILTVLNRRYPGLPVRLYPTAVQGNEAAAQIVNAIELANREGLADVLIIGRGGGSLEDLWPFNEEAVALSLAHSKIPTVSAVGHEIDFSIADMVADLRAPTPSAAAELLSPNGAEILAKINRAERALKQRFDWLISAKQAQLNSLRQRLRHPGERIREQAQRCDELELRLHSSMNRLMRDKRNQLNQNRNQLGRLNPSKNLTIQHDLVKQLMSRLERLTQAKIDRRTLELAEKAGRLHAISPLATLERGYALATTDQQEVIRDSRQVKAGQSINIRLRKGSIKTTVTEIKTENEA
jgi:exodeoxyribonuclease VII large subunit